MRWILTISHLLKASELLRLPPPSLEDIWIMLSKALHLAEIESIDFRVEVHKIRVMAGTKQALVVPQSFGTRSSA